MSNISTLLEFTMMSILSLFLLLITVDGNPRQKRVVWLGVKYVPMKNGTFGKIRPFKPYMATSPRPAQTWTALPASPLTNPPIPSTRPTAPTSGATATITTIPTIPTTATAFWLTAPTVNSAAIPLHVPSTNLQLCSPDFVPQVVVQTGDGNTFVFQGDHYWQVMDFQGNVVDNRMKAGSKIAKDWPGLPNNLDAAITLADGTTLFFKDDRFYVFWNKMPREPATGFIEAAFPYMPPADIDAAFMTNTSLVFIKGPSFYLFGVEQFPFVQRGNTIDMGLPDLPVESAVNLSDGLAYLIVENIVYQMDTSSLQVISTFPTQSLYGCLEPLKHRKMHLRPYGRQFHPEISDLKSWTAAMLSFKQYNDVTL
ncbi:hypothetical protein RvY_18081-2 [Ramazzottius varieornatus]|uniref:Uncharacterized protein n=1 Tax=Ramazzottius varieornatus TaxID=947166 RepID=A0A1D1W4G3_RAMVA|nr:hypothetical protein RvY_18081-2 [Ramazzottius varieornatus]